jgi:glycogen debranching enzyme
MDLAKDSILILIENHLPDGTIPHFVTVDWVRPGEESQPPVVAWAAWKVYERSRDRDFLRSVYDALARNTDWWFMARDQDDDGLLEWHAKLESGWDNSPRWDPGIGKLESCDLNAFVLMQMKVLAQMADELGKTDQAERWLTEADALGKRMVERLYQPEENLFREIRYDTHEPVDILTLASFLPLWAGVPLEPGKAEAMIQDYLLNPRYFWSEMPFPVVACCDPRYDPANFWRGPSWLNLNYMMAEMLHRYGFHDEAEEAVRRTLDAGARNTYICEYYNSQTGEGLGVREYGWTAAFFMEMLLGRYGEQLSAGYRSS